MMSIYRHQRADQGPVHLVVIFVFVRYRHHSVCLTHAACLDAGTQAKSYQLASGWKHLEDCFTVSSYRERVWKREGKPSGIGVSFETYVIQLVRLHRFNVVEVGSQ